MARPLLPGNATALERLATQALAEIERVPVPIRDLVSPERCPVALLPYLAWAFSVDRWEAGWSEATKRQVIRSAWFVHAHKGTLGSLRRVVEPLGYRIRVTEWWQTTPTGPRGTFALELRVLEGGISDVMHDTLMRLIDDAKPLSRHLAGMTISLEARGPIALGAVTLESDTLTVYPQAPGPIEVASRALVAGATSHLIDTLSVYP